MTDETSAFAPPGTGRHCWLRLRSHAWVPDLRELRTGWTGMYCTDCRKVRPAAVPPASAFR